MEMDDDYGNMSIHSSHAAMASVVRHARESDLLQIHAIFEHYVANTVMSFLTKKLPLDYVQSRYETSIERGLPYIVAEQRLPGNESKIVGYAYATPFRGYMLGYGHTVEIAIYCHPEYTNQGIGSSLMKKLLRTLPQARHISHEEGHEAEYEEFEVRQVVAIMAVDASRDDEGLGLRDWYMRWGFEEVGRLKKVGFKDDRW